MQNSSLSRSGTVRRSQLFNQTTRTARPSSPNTSGGYGGDSVTLSGSASIINESQNSSNSVLLPNGFQGHSTSVNNLGVHSNISNPLGSGSNFTGLSSTSQHHTFVGPNSFSTSTSQQNFLGTHTSITGQAPSGAITTTEATTGLATSYTSYSSAGPGHVSHGTQANAFLGSQVSISGTNHQDIGNTTLSLQSNLAAQSGVGGNLGYQSHQSADGVSYNANGGFHIGTSVSTEHTVSASNDSGDSVALTGGLSYGPAVSFDADGTFDTTGDSTTIGFQLGGNVLGGGTIGAQVTISDETLDDLTQPLITPEQLGNFAGSALALFREGGGPQQRHDYRA